MGDRGWIALGLGWCWLPGWNWGWVCFCWKEGGFFIGHCRVISSRVGEGCCHCFRGLSLSRYKAGQERRVSQGKDKAQRRFSEGCMCLYWLHAVSLALAKYGFPIRVERGTALRTAIFRNALLTTSRLALVWWRIISPIPPLSISGPSFQWSWWS